MVGAKEIKRVSMGATVTVKPPMEKKGIIQEEVEWKASLFGGKRN